MLTDLVLLQVIRQVGNHDLGLRGNAILRGAALLALARLTGLTRGGGLLLVGALCYC